jgi:hypothetical protein
MKKKAKSASRVRKIRQPSVNISVPATADSEQEAGLNALITLARYHSLSPTAIETTHICGAIAIKNRVEF